MGMLVFTLRANFLPQGPIFISVERPEHPMEHYSAKSASTWHFNTKLRRFGTKVKSLKSEKIKILMYGVTWHGSPIKLTILFSMNLFKKVELWFNN